MRAAEYVLKASCASNRTISARIDPGSAIWRRRIWRHRFRIDRERVLAVHSLPKSLAPSAFRRHSPDRLCLTTTFATRLPPRLSIIQNTRVMQSIKLQAVMVMRKGDTSY